MRITVLMGGTSAERDVSIASGLRIVQALREREHDVTAFDTARGVIAREDEAAVAAEGMKVEPPSLETLASMERGSLSPSLGSVPAVRDADAVFLALHGGQGEDGTIQALLDLSGVRYTGSGHLASALAMDKDLSKQLFRAAGVATAEWLMAPATADEVVRKLGMPVIVKPSKQGSTVGLTLVREASELAAAVADAQRYDDEVMIEAFIPGRELTVGILGDEALPVGEIIPKHELYDYECKYTAGMAVEEFPAKLGRDEAACLQDEALRAFRALKLRGYARIDFRRRSDGVAFCLEANTLPGMTELSLLPQAAQAAGISFSELCERIVYLAMPTVNRP
ncbi:MAG: D-alanine--D-alanine ligase [Gemmatimonadaceae bacterium]